MRRRLERRGFEFNTDNDSELIAVYLADKIRQGVPLKAGSSEVAGHRSTGASVICLATPEGRGGARESEPAFSGTLTVRREAQPRSFPDQGGAPNQLLSTLRPLFSTASPSGNLSCEKAGSSPAFSLRFALRGGLTHRRGVEERAQGGRPLFFFPAGWRGASSWSPWCWPGRSICAGWRWRPSSV